MMITIMKSKIHNATVTQADLYYEGSITIDQDFMDRMDILPGERVQIVNLENGERLETYTISGERGSGMIGMNGPAALKCAQGDRVHIISYALMDKESARDYISRVLVLEKKNRIKKEIQE
ncbi:MAG: aspartate 1-decarboxylase [candidate division KSB1 bacterium]|nr:aspartate 1-decarboxylase [candidate division KSB1 bacterium]